LEPHRLSLTSRFTYGGDCAPAWASFSRLRDLHVTISKRIVFRVLHKYTMALAIGFAGFPLLSLAQVACRITNSITRPPEMEGPAFGWGSLALLRAEERNPNSEET